MKCQILLFFLISFTLGIETNNSIVYEIEEFYEILSKTLISEEEANKLINNLKKILERYVYLDIAKKPPQPSEEYHNKVDLLKDLDNVNKQNMRLFDFYRDVKIIIDKCQDLHLDIDLKKEFENGITLHNSFFISPVVFAISNNELVSAPNPLIIDKNYFDDNLMDIIKANEKKNFINKWGRAY